MGIGVHFDKDEDDWDKPLFGRHWLDDMEHEKRPLFGMHDDNHFQNHIPTPPKESNWDELYKKWKSQSSAILNTHEDYVEWLKRNYNPPTKKL